MRIVTWNCCQGFAAKLPLLLGLDFDVAVVPECGPVHVGLDQHRELTSVLRQPVPGGSKHLGVFAQDPWQVEPLHLSSAVEMPWVLPVAVSGPLEFTLLAVWTQSKPSPYTAQTHRVVAELLPLLSGPVMVAGDFNAPGHAASHHLTPHLATVGLLDDAGLVSAFAAARGVAQSDLYRDGPDTQPSPALQEPTYYHWRRRDLPWHIDHVFVRRDWTDGIATSVGSYDDWVATGHSDHVPVVVDLQVP